MSRSDEVALTYEDDEHDDEQREHALPQEVAFDGAVLLEQLRRRQLGVVTCGHGVSTFSLSSLATGSLRGPAVYAPTLVGHDLVPYRVVNGNVSVGHWARMALLRFCRGHVTRLLSDV